MILFEALKQEIILSCAGLLFLAIEMISPGARRLVAAIAYTALALAAYLNPPGIVGGFSFLILAGTAVAILLAQADTFQARRMASFVALVFFASVGCLLLAKSSDFLFAFLAIELISISSFILVAYEREELAPLEGAVKYFLVGAFSAAIGLYGISLFYAATGTMDFRAAAAAVSNSGEWGPWLALTGVLLILASFAFKASIVPFHFWVPDAYQSAPTPVTAYLSVVPKLAAMAVMLHLFTVAGADLAGPFLRVGGMGSIVAMLACLTMTVGNVSAIHQTDLKRLLAYSSIAQAGYMMLGLLAATALGVHAVLFYGFSYLFMNFGAFACAMWVERKTGSYELGACDSLAINHFPFALTFSAFLLSLAGIPPMAGFIGKYLVFASIIDSGWMTWVAVVGVLNSVISVYYYLGIVYRMFFIEKGARPTVGVHSPILAGALILLLAGTIIFGIYPTPLLALSGIK